MKLLVSTVTGGSPSAMRARNARGAGGFTLIEVMVALVVMAVMTVMAWRAVSTLSDSRERNEATMVRAETLQTLMRQWEIDLREVQDTKLLPAAISFDGATLRITKRRDGGVQLVVWQLRNGRLARWESALSTNSGQLQDAWFRSQQLTAPDMAQMPGLNGISGWQMYFFRINAWTNAQSEGDKNQQGQTAMPSGVRMRLQFAPDSGYRGELERTVLTGSSV